MKVKVWYRPEVVGVEIDIDDSYRKLLDDDLSIKEYGEIADALADDLGQLLPADADYLCSVEDAVTGEILVDC
jgi:hypothetical protein